MSNKYEDHLGSVDLQHLQQGMFQLIDVQDRSPTKSFAYAALAALFVMESKELGIDMSTAISSMTRAIAQLHQNDPEIFRAIRDYIQGEM